MPKQQTRKLSTEAKMIFHNIVVHLFIDVVVDKRENYLHSRPINLDCYGSVRSYVVKTIFHAIMPVRVFPGFVKMPIDFETVNVRSRKEGMKTYTRTINWPEQFTCANANVRTNAIGLETLSLSPFLSNFLRPNEKRQNY